MAIKPKSERENKKQVIDLSGSQGNSFFLIGTAVKFAKQIGYTEEQKQKMVDEMKSGDYENLIETFDKHFGMIVDLQR